MFAPQPILNEAEFSYIYQGSHENCGAPPLFSTIVNRERVGEKGKKIEIKVSLVVIDVLIIIVFILVGLLRRCRLPLSTVLFIFHFY